jgi:antitoxin component YwqK of YwqJK toxin-antitoxin module
MALSALPPDPVPAGEPVPAVDHYENGQVRFRGTNVEGEMHGPWEFFRRDGSLLRAGEFVLGRQAGIWRTFDRAGRLVKETDFSKPVRG